MGDDKKGPQDDHLLAALGLTGFATFVALMKCLPPVLLGAFLGYLVYFGAGGGSIFKRIRAQILGLLFLALLLYTCAGLPWEMSGSEERFPGLLFYSQTFRHLVLEAVGWWNGLALCRWVPKLREDLRHLPEVRVAFYFWLSFASAAVVTVLCDGFRLFKRRPAHVAPSFLAFPSQFIERLFQRAVWVWVKRARVHVLLGEGGALPGAGRAVFSVGLFLGVGGLVSHFLVSRVPYLDLRLITQALALLPGAGLLVGLFLGVLHCASSKLGITKALSRKRPDGFELGKDELGRPYFLTSRNLAYHVEIVASSGAGKTNLLKNLLEDRISRGHGIVFLDLKADFELLHWLRGVAAAHAREEDLRVVSLSDPGVSIPYNPIAGGTASEIHSQLMNAWHWSNEYYRSIASVALMALLQGLCDWRDATGEHFHLGHIYELLEEPGALREFQARVAERGLESARELSRLADKLDRPTDKKELSGLIANLNQVLYSAAGKLLSRDLERGESLDLRAATQEGCIIYFPMNSLKLKESAQVLGKLVLQDLMRVVGDRYAGGKESAGRTPRAQKPITLIIDEFGAFAVPEFIEFMDRARGAGCGIVIAHQSRADLACISPEFLKRVEANANTKIVGSLECADDREYYARILGTRTTQKETIQLEDGLLGSKPTGIKSLREVEEFVIHPNEIANLERGEVFTVSRTVDSRWGVVRIPLNRALNRPRFAAAEVGDRGEKRQESHKYLELYRPGRKGRVGSGRPGLTPGKGSVESGAVHEDKPVDLWR